ncbi:MAG: hypothetical protein KatS3mg087_0854 [Patescibacteria group bacterium]|nr:MAG: hypothetical protein KatS3mg087_0854 [Patescibacteria group bacterium]
MKDPSDLKGPLGRLVEVIFAVAIVVLKQVGAGGLVADAQEAIAVEIVLSVSCDVDRRVSGVAQHHIPLVSRDGHMPVDAVSLRSAIPPRVGLEEVDAGRERVLGRSHGRGGGHESGHKADEQGEQGHEVELLVLEAHTVLHCELERLRTYVGLIRLKTHTFVRGGSTTVYELQHAVFGVLASFL